ncbi:MAG: hypothetical protein ABJN26_23850 [Stappiaceae bacterium]
MDIPGQSRSDIPLEWRHGQERWRQVYRHLKMTGYDGGRSIKPDDMPLNYFDRKKKSVTLPPNRLPGEPSDHAPQDI